MVNKNTVLINPHQFRMFIPAHELMKFGPGDDRSESEYSEAYGLLERKRRDNTETRLSVDNQDPEPLIKSVAKKGVHTPVTIMENDNNNESTIWNGHHRIVAAYDVNPNMEVPVEHVL
jgi:hypothetical protein